MAKDNSPWFIYGAENEPRPFHVTKNYGEGMSPQEYASICQKEKEWDEFKKILVKASTFYLGGSTVSHAGSKSGDTGILPHGQKSENAINVNAATINPKDQKDFVCTAGRHFL